MYLIQEVLVSAEVFNRKFVCHIDKCKGACCWEGDYGAPVAAQEKSQIKDSLEKIKNLLSKEAIEQINDFGSVVYDNNYKGEVTPLLSNGSCIYLSKNDQGQAICSFQKAYHQGDIDFIKPVSCQLYPLRVSSNEENGFEAINYDVWDICADACNLGEELSMPVFRFVKDALVRKYGQEFYDEMEKVYEHISSQ